MPAFLPQTMGYAPVTVIEALNAGLAVLSVGLLSVAWLSDRMPRKPLALVGSGLLLVLAWPFFDAAQEHRIGLIALFSLACAAASLCSGTVIAVCADLFPTRIRFSGVALSYNLSFTIFSGLAPVSAALLASRSGVPATAAVYMAGCALLSLGAALVMHKYDGRILADAVGARPDR
jgi:hypothetical protein